MKMFARNRESPLTKGEVELVLLLELVLLGVGQDAVADALGIGRAERLDVLDRSERAVDPQLRGGAGGDVEIRGPLLDHLLEELVQTDHGPPP
jgi:hypothetical protein